ncbi:type II toxin-antitoxin system RelE/ParE family toxin [Sphingomonas sp. Leaf33]|uniref:type II toxin-antitoxin system RelE/ParE family toxin n=1 Tax=Sphingomonas sp. Leaf33 TaxID=1736215 RepID=UPI000AA22F16
MSGLQWASSALTDLASIDQYHRQDHIDVADELTERIISAARFLSATPMAGPVSPGGNRKWRVAGTPYIIFYRPSSRQVRILRVLHGARDTGRW